jgi:ABC-2 type transport system permease protein
VLKLRVKAIAFRIFTELRHDKRTLALVLFAPVLMLTLIFFVLNSSLSNSNVGVLNAPSDYFDRLYESNVTVTRFLDEKLAFDSLNKGEITAIINIVDGKSYIYVDGSNSQESAMAVSLLETAKKPQQPTRADQVSDITYVYGADDLETFDNFGSVLIGVLVFFFVFIVAGMSFLQERTTGTLEKMLSTPIKRWELVLGYVLGFGSLTIVQSTLITFYVVYVLGIMMIGSIWLVLLITLLTAICALTLGMLLSTAASSQFQMLQFIPIVVVPQIFFCGLFQLSPEWDAIGRFMPLYYSADALNEIMIRGNGLSSVSFDIFILLTFSVVFVFGNIKLLKKYRNI